MKLVLGIFTYTNFAVTNARMSSLSNIQINLTNITGSSTTLTH